MKTKKCTKCGKVKSIEDFYLHSQTKDGYRTHCKNCMRRESRLNRRRRTIHEYGITEVDYEMMLKSQNGVCAICGLPEIVKQADKIQSLSIDHDHKTYRVRGLLCENCNHMLGKVKDNPEILEKGAEYLRRNNVNIT